jgi:prevent-host-death family protein
MVEAKSKVAELVGKVKYAGQRYVLARRGPPMAVLISLEECERLQVESGAAARARSSPLPQLGRQRQEIP